MCEGDGSVYSWGRGTFGRLGTGSELDQLFPAKVKFDSMDKRTEVKIVGVSAGAYHSLALSGKFYVLCFFSFVIIRTRKQVPMLC